MLKYTFIIIPIIVAVTLIGITTFFIFLKQESKDMGGIDTTDWNTYIDKTGIDFKYPRHLYISSEENTSVVFEAKSLPDNISGFSILFRKWKFNKPITLENFKEEFPGTALGTENIILINGVKSVREVSQLAWESPSVPSDWIGPYYYESIYIPYGEIVYEFTIELSLKYPDEQTQKIARDYYNVYFGMVNSITFPD